MTVSDVYVVGSASAFGSRVVPSEDVDHAFGMPAGKLKSRAGIVSVAHASEHEDEGTLGLQACKQLLEETGQEADGLDWIVAASETHHAYPSLSAILHAKLRLRENCNALDVGSGCLALLQNLAVAQALLVSGRATENSRRYGRCSQSNAGSRPCYRRIWRSVWRWRQRFLAVKQASRCKDICLPAWRIFLRLRFAVCRNHRDQRIQ